MASSTHSMDMSLSKLWERVKHRQTWCASVHGVTRVGHNLATKQQTISYIYNSVTHSFKGEKKSGAIYFSKNDSLMADKSLGLALCCCPRGPTGFWKQWRRPGVKWNPCWNGKQRFRKMVSQVKVKRIVKLRSFISCPFSLYHSSSWRF